MDYLGGNMDKINVGIVGLGRSGWDIHSKLLEKLSDRYRVAAVCDADPLRRNEAERQFKSRSYETLPEFLKDSEVELAIIATPSHLHAANTIEALKAGRNVVCEKPMAGKLSDADLMIKTAKKTGKVLTVFHNRRYFPDFLKVREVINSGKLGRIVEIKMTWNGFGRRWDWQTLRKFGGGTLNNTCPHAIDQALHLFGDKEPEIYCHMEKTVALGDAEDHVKIIFRAKGAPMVDLEVSSACAYAGDSWLIMGTQGGLRGEFTKLQWKYFDPAKLPRRTVSEFPVADRSYNADNIPWQEESWDIDQDRSPGQAGFYVDLYETLKNNAPLAITPESARRVMWVIERCHKIAGI